MWVSIITCLLYKFRPKRCLSGVCESIMMDQREKFCSKGLIVEYVGEALLL